MGFISNTTLTQSALRSIVYIVCLHEPREKLKEVTKPSLTIFIKQSASTERKHTLRAPTLQGLILSRRSFKDEL